MKLFLSLIALTGLGLGTSQASDSFSPPSARSATVQLHLEVDRPVLPADSVETLIVKAALVGGRPVHPGRLPVNLALVIDKSGSMSGEKIVRAREAALEAVSRLAPTDIVSLVVYDNEVSVLVPASPVGNGERLRRAIQRIGASGGTNLHGGVVAGAGQLREYLRQHYVHRVILLSDGQANVGPSSPAELGRLGASLVADGISVSTIGLGLDFNEDLMTRLARQSDGNTYFVADSSALPRIFQQELGDVLAVIARRVVVEIQFPVGVRPRRLVGREGRLEDQRVVVEMNQLYAGQERFALVEVELDPGQPGRSREIAVATVRYEDGVNPGSTSASARTAARFTTSEQEVVAGVNQRVQADYAANRLAEVKDEAVALVDSGRRDEAAERLRSVAGSLQRDAARYANTAVAEMVAPAPAEADRLATEGLTNARRKTYRAEAQQTYSQQSGSDD
jgi:Ca-activated chloride channel homolog